MPATVQVATGANELTYVGTDSFDSVADRKAPGDILGAGAFDASDYDVSYAGSGLNLQVNAGVGYVRGTNVEQGLYRVRQGTNVTTLSCGSNSSGNPRIDRVILRVYDNDAEAAGAYKANVEVIAGNPTTGATLDNLTGAVAMSSLGAPKTALLLADVLVPDGASSILAANINDRRSFATKTIPGLDLTTYDAVPLEWCPAAGRVSTKNHSGSDFAQHQSFALAWCPRRILGVTKVRWRYAITTTIPSGTNWNMAIADASGRFITTTGNVPFDSSAAVADNQVAQAWAAPFDIEIGYCYIGFGVGAFSGGGAVRWTGIIPDTLNTGSATGFPADGPLTQNLVFRSGSAGVTFGSGANLHTIDYLTDAYNIANGQTLGIPNIVLSVG